MWFGPDRTLYFSRGIIVGVPKTSDNKLLPEIYEPSCIELENAPAGMLEAVDDLRNISGMTLLL